MGRGCEHDPRLGMAEPAFGFAKRPVGFADGAPAPKGPGAGSAARGQRKARPEPLSEGQRVGVFIS